mgnify:CR=1 FL=1
MCVSYCSFFFFQAEDGIRDLVRSRGLGDVYKRQVQDVAVRIHEAPPELVVSRLHGGVDPVADDVVCCLSLIHI